MEYKKKKANRLHIKRAEHLISQEELAFNVGTTRQTIHAIESGKSIPACGLAMKIARYFKCDVETIFRLEDYE